MERLWVIAAAVAVALLVGLDLGEEPESPGRAASRAETHIVVVRTTLVGPRIYYIEGALVRVGLWPDGDPRWYDAHRTPPMAVGEDVTRLVVPSGAYELIGEVVPCSGNCGEMGAGFPACALPLEVDRDVEVVVRFRWGALCEVVALRP